jgi:HEAT repeat protein
LKERGTGLDPAELADFRRLTGVAIDDVDRLTLGCSLTDRNTWTMVLHTTRVVAPSDLYFGQKPPAKETKIGKITLYQSDEGAFFLPNDHTIVVGRLAVLQKVVERGKAADLPTGFEGVSILAEETGLFRVIVDARQLPKSGAWVAGIEVSPILAAVPVIPSAVRIETRDGELRASMRCKDETEAEDVRQSLRKAIIKLTVVDLDAAQSRLVEALQFESEDAMVVGRLPLSADLLRTPIVAMKWERVDYCLDALTSDVDARRKEAETRLLRQPAQTARQIALLLQHSEEKKRAAGELLLMKMSKDAAVAAPVLVTMLDDAQPSNRRAAAQAIGLLGSGARGVALAPLLRCQSDGDVEVRTAARDALARLGPPTANDVKGLVEAIRDGRIDPAARARALATFLTMDALKDELPLQVALFTTTVKDKDKEVRRLSTVALGKIGTRRREEVFPALVLSLKDREEGVRAAAANALAALGSPTTTEMTPLIEMFKDDALAMTSRTAAATALGRCIKKNRDEAFTALFDALNHANSEVREASAAALEKLGEAKPRDLPELAREVANGRASIEMKRYLLRSLAQLGPRVDRERYPHIPRTLMDLLTGADPELSDAAFEAIKAMGPPRDVESPRLVGVFKDRSSSPRARAYAAWALGSLAREERDLVGILLQAMADSSVLVRRAAAEALGAARLQSPEVVKALGNALRDDDRAVRLHAAGTIAALPVEARALAHLIRAFEDDDLAIMRKGAEGLARYGKPSKQDVAILGEACVSTKLRTRLFAVSSLAELGPESLPVLDVLTNALRDSNPTVRQLATVAVRGIGMEAKSATSALVAQLKDRNARVRLEAAVTLVMLQTEAKEAVSTLVESAMEKSNPDRPLARQSLTRLGGWAAPAVPYLVGMVEKEDGRPLACDALTAIGKEAVSGIVSSLRSRDAGVRLALVETLGRIGPTAHSALLDVLRIAQNDASPEVRTAARKASQLIQKK